MKQKIKSIFFTSNIMIHLFLLFCIFIFVNASISPLRNLFSDDPFFTIVILLVFILIVLVIWYILKRVNLTQGKIELICIIGIIIFGLLLRVGVNKIIKTVPVSDFATPHVVYQSLKSGTDIFSFKENFKDLSFYQQYYAKYPAWFSYMKIVSLIYDIFGQNLRYIKIMNLGLYVITALLLYWIIKKISSMKSAILGILLFSIFPSLIVYTNITTPDHFTILFFTCFIATWIKLLEYRKRKDKKIFVWCILNILSIIFINLFKPLSILGLLVFVCTELLYFVFPILCNKEKRKQYIKESLVFSITFIIICYFGISISSKLLNRTVEKTIHTEVVDSTPLYLLWAYSLDEDHNYNPEVATKVYEELINKYNYNQQKIMEELWILAKEQLIENMPYIFDILEQKFNILFSSERDVFEFANYSDNEEYQATIVQKFYKNYIFSANMFMCIMCALSVISIFKELFASQKNPMKIVILLTMIGYILILLLGGIQGRYKMIIASLFCMLASFSFTKKEEEEKIC